MKYKNLFILITIFFLANSCVEIIDDLTLNSDGSGTFKYTLNLSASKIKINSILALDSLDGRKVPSIEEIKQRVNHFKSKLESKSGITNITLESNYSDYIFKIKCDFTSLIALQNAIHDVIIEENLNKNIKELTENWVTWDGQKLIRNIPEFTFNKKKEFSETEIEQLKLGKYTSVTRFDRPIEKFVNNNAKLAPSKMAIMLQTNTYSLIQNLNLLENTIYLSPLKKD
ncbi:MAG: hypothetical protein HYR91_02085 [Flavobacteriia bacterium]|nr:hypothetical protein [Flavobacteriia bacterium]